MSGEHSDWLFWDGRRCRVLTRTLRDYRVTWILEDDRLYITALDAVPVAELFPHKPAAVPARWYSGTLRIAEGDPLPMDVPDGQPKYACETCLVLDRGTVVAETRVTWKDAEEEEQ